VIILSGACHGQLFPLPIGSFDWDRADDLLQASIAVSLQTLSTMAEMLSLGVLQHLGGTVPQEGQFQLLEDCWV